MTKKTPEPKNDDPLTPPDKRRPSTMTAPLTTSCKISDDADPTAVDRPAFPDERSNEERGNRGPDEEPGFGQGA